MKEWTCTCIKSYYINDDLSFINKHEYQVDIYPLYYKVYINGDWKYYEYFDENTFNQYFKLIEM